VEPFPATVVRVATAAVGIWCLLPALGAVRNTLRGFTDRRAMTIIVCGTIVGPVVGIWTSMIALAGVESGIASALISTSPIMMIPMAFLAYGERPTLRAFVGTAIAVGGITLLMCR